MFGAARSFYRAGPTLQRDGAARLASSPIASVEVLNSEVPKELVTDKGAVLDLRLELADGRQIDVHLVEPPKLPARGAHGADEPLLEDWGRFLSARSDEELEELAMSNPVMAKAKGALDFLSAQPDVQELARQRELAVHAYLTQMQGERAEGEAKGRAEALLLLLSARGSAVTAPVRERIASCRDIPQLEQWLRRAAAVTAVEELFA